MTREKSRLARLSALSACLLAASSGCEPIDGLLDASTSGAMGALEAGNETNPQAGDSGNSSGAIVDSGSNAGPASGGDAGMQPVADAGNDAASNAWCAAKAVFDKYCVSCHDGQGTAGAPMALKRYADLTASSQQYPGSKIFERVGARMHATESKMPPQGTVSQSELRAVDAWIAAGAPGSDQTTCGPSGSAPGNTSDAGSGDAWPADCDKTYKITAHDTADATKPFRMGANLESHPGFTFDAPWGSEQVQALAFRPITDNKKILHHWILYQNSGTRAFLTGWAPGQDAAQRKMRPDVGMYVPSGAQSLYLDMHYYNLGSGTKEELDASGVEVCVVGKAKFRPNMASVFMGFAGIGFPMVPAMVTNHNLTANCTVSTTMPVHLLTASPHAHKFANYMKFTAKVGGREIVMHDAPFDFNEQTSHPLAEDVVLNTGDSVTTVCTYTNPTNQAINFSENTDGEMCFNFAVYYPMGALSCGGGGGSSGGGLLGGLFGDW